MSDFTSDADRQFLDTTSSSTHSPPSSPVVEGEEAEAGPSTGPVGESGAWSPERSRVLGALIEKALATPQNYPLSLNALTMACNQTTNRDPILEMSELDVEAELATGKTDGLLRFVHPRSGRGVTKYRQVVDEAMGLAPTELALLGVLLLRGPQTASELRTRTERMAPMEPEAVEDTLAALEQRPEAALVRRLEREPGHREPRWIQLLCPAQGEERAGQPATASPRRAAGIAGSAGAGAEVEVESLRGELAAVRTELDQLRAEFEAFRAEFG